AFRWDPRMAVFAATGVILSATYMLWMFQRVNYGPVSNEKNAGLRDLVPREWAVLVPVIAVAVLMGVLPNIFLSSIEPSVDRVISRVHGAAGRIQAGGATESGFGIRESGFGIRESGFGIRESGFGIRESGFGSRESAEGSEAGR